MSRKGIALWWGTLLVLTVLPTQASIKQAIRVDVNISGTIIATASCTFSGQKPLQIDYGDVYIDELTSGNNRRSLDYSLVCRGDSDGKKVEMKFVGDGADFDGQLLKTNTKGLGIKLLNNSNLQAINSWFTIDPGNQPALEAELVKQDNATFQNGQTFSGVVTLVVEYR
ncbi:fimbrial protein [Enterobacter bugandensis]|uniref:Fimbrial protein n=1 Tax=Enterobacter bugandensis TaxID=881260 RepID=A0AA42PVH2_9ENTR|nr:fimbrial protein [Enterobacter bugandensis]MDH1321537.1 fimbrial protein [Enterobacter bugandensis]